MDVHRSTSLELGDLGIGDTDLGPQRGNAQTRQGRELAGQVRDRPPPQSAEVRVPQGRGLVVVAVGAERLPDPGIALGMTLETAHRDAVLAHIGRSTWPARADSSPVDHAAMDRAERGCGERREDERVRADRS